MFDGFVARRKDATNGANTDIPAVAAGTNGGRVSEPATGVAPGMGNPDASGGTVDAGRSVDQPNREPVPSAAGVDAETVTNQPQAIANITPEATETIAQDDQKRTKAVERISKGSAYFSNGLKAQQFIAQNGLKEIPALSCGLAAS